MIDKIKEVFTTVIILAIIVAVIMFAAWDRSPSHKNDLHAPIYYTLGKATDEVYDGRRRFVKFIYRVKGVQYENAQDINLNVALQLGGTYVVLFSVNDPQHSAIQMHHPVPWQMEEAPAQGWDFPPDQDIPKGN